MFDCHPLNLNLDIELLSPAWIARAWIDGDPEVRETITRRQSAQEAYWQRRFDDPAFDHECRNPIFKPVRDSLWTGRDRHDPDTIDPDTIRPAWL